MNARGTPHGGAGWTEDKGTLTWSRMDGGQGHTHDAHVVGQCSSLARCILGRRCRSGTARPQATQRTCECLCRGKGRNVMWFAEHMGHVSIFDVWSEACVCCEEYVGGACAPPSHTAQTREDQVNSAQTWTTDAQRSITAITRRSSRCHSDIVQP